MITMSNTGAIQNIRTRPRQAVILAGGKGTRLKPLTDNMPKPMVRFHGKPFLEYLIRQVKEEGFDKVLLLLGYYPEVIQDYFGDGSDFDVSIEYSVTDVEYETGTRLRIAKQLIDPYFLLMYCDNYWPMDFARMWESFKEKNTDVQIVVYTNKDSFTKNNLCVDNSSMVTTYDKSRSAKNLQGVDIGYAIIKKEVIDLISSDNVNFEKIAYPQLTENGSLAAFETDHRYYSVGNLQRLPLTKTFFEQKRVIFLDRDGVLNKKAPKAHYVTKPEEFIWLPGAIEAVKLLKKAGYIIIIISNQAGVSRGMMTKNDLDSIHMKLHDDLAKEGVTINAIYVCTHGWNDGCDCRKPKPGMFFQAQRDYHLDLRKSFFIGDDIRDKEAGDAAGCKTFLVSPEFSLFQCVKKNIGSSI